MKTLLATLALAVIIALLLVAGLRGKTGHHHSTSGCGVPNRKKKSHHRQ